MQKNLSRLNRHYSNMLVHHCRVKLPSEVYDISVTLSLFFPEPDDVMIGIYELLLNAIEHGNLGIGSAEKTRLLQQGKWHEEAALRLASPQYAGKYVDVSVWEDANECHITIADQGLGFNWNLYADNDVVERSARGLGLRIARNCGFDSVAFNPAGNHVSCSVKKHR